MPYKHDRAFYRLQYPPAAAPQFSADGLKYRVVDIGEGGFRYALIDAGGPLDGHPVTGIIEFPDEDPLTVVGVVVRTQSGEVAVHCTPRPIPLALVLREQRRLRKRYPFRA
jgi:hypothetical protein